jgi:pimeloyl-ACP methyl ester carboxylesterase/DNA-binding CsgD family transcriptional regulator
VSVVELGNLTYAEQKQEIRFCQGRHGARIAYAIHGSGPPLVIVSCWLSHLQYDWQSPVWRHFLEDLGRIATLVRYDERGFGLSDWTVSDFSLEARLADLEAIIEASGLQRFALMGMSGGSPIALAYAAQHPDRVTRLIVYGGRANGRLGDDPDRVAREEAYRALIRAGWAQPEGTFRRVFTSTFIPGASEPQMSWMDDLQRMSTSRDNAVNSRIARQQIDVTDLLPAIRAPALVLHARGDHAVPFDGALQLSTSIPDARLVPLESQNHILLGDEPAWHVFLAEVSGFMELDRSHPVSGAALLSGAERAGLSPREREILRLAAGGLGNVEIAQKLTISARTVERHLSNAYLKLGLSGRAARTGAVARVLYEELTDS